MLKVELQALNADYMAVSGKAAKHFFCPILFRDELTDLCLAHVINRSFPNSSRSCTVQRADVDSFYGSRFEADFADITKLREITPEHVIGNSALSRRFNATVFLDDEPVPHFFSREPHVGPHTQVSVGDPKLALHLGLKMQPSEVAAAEGGRWEIGITRDLRLPMLVSAIKSAHLSLFKLLGYRYALSAAGHFIGSDILGRFFLQNNGGGRDIVEQRARIHFQDFVHMVRPVISESFNSQGTVTDGTVLMCIGSSGTPWASIVFLKTDHLLHGVLIPNMQDPEQATTFLDFLANSNPNIQVATGYFKNDHWEISSNALPLIWPKAGISLVD